MPDSMPRSAAMQQLLKMLGDQISGFMITPPGHEAPTAMINITPLPGDFDLHGAFSGPMEAALAAAAEEKGEMPPMMDPPTDDMLDDMLGGEDDLDIEALDDDEDIDMDDAIAMDEELDAEDEEDLEDDDL